MAELTIQEMLLKIYPRFSTVKRLPYFRGHSNLILVGYYSDRGAYEEVIYEGEEEILEAYEEAML